MKSVSPFVSVASYRILENGSFVGSKHTHTQFKIYLVTDRSKEGGIGEYNKS